MPSTIELGETKRSFDTMFNLGHVRRAVLEYDSDVKVYLENCMVVTMETEAERLEHYSLHGERGGVMDASIHMNTMITLTLRVSQASVRYGVKEEEKKPLPVEELVRMIRFGKNGKSGI